MGVFTPNSGDAHDDGSPTMYPTFMHPSHRTYEIISIAALSTLVLLLLAAFFSGWYLHVTKNSWNQVTQESGHGTEIDSSKHLPSKSQIQYNDESEIEKFKNCLNLYLSINENMNVSHYWIVPNSHPWPEKYWGFPLGKYLNRLLEPNKKVDSENLSAANHQEGETWYELFYDLVFVAAALQLGMVIKYDHRLLGLIKSAILFLMLRSTWDHLTMYQNRYHSNDLAHMSYYLMQAMCAFVIALHLQVKDSDLENQHSWDRQEHQEPIAMMATTSRILTLFMYIYAYMKNPSHSKYLSRAILHTFLSGAVFAASMFCPESDDLRLYLWVWGLGIFVERPLMNLIAYLQDDDCPALVMPHQVKHLVERQSTFFMLILGEAVIQLVQAHGGYDRMSQVRALIGFAVVFNVGSVYYDQQQRDVSKHVMLRSVLLGYLYVELQSAISLSVLFFAVGVKLVFHSFNEQQIFRDEMLMCSFASVSLVLMYTVSLMHRGWDFNFTNGSSSRLLYHGYFLAVALACGLIPYWARSSTLTVISLCLLTSTLVIQDVYRRARRVYELRVLGHVSDQTASAAWTTAMDASISSDIWRYASDSHPVDSSSNANL